MNTIIVYPNQWAGFILHNPYVIEIDRENRNCYNCGRFGYLAKNCKNRIENRIGKGKRLEYRNKNNGQNNLNGKGDLVVLNQILVITTDSQYSLEQ